jgi:hypothetical protein
VALVFVEVEPGAAVIRLSYLALAATIAFIVLAVVMREGPPTLFLGSAWLGVCCGVISLTLAVMDYWQLHRKPKHRLRDDDGH